LNQQKYVDIRVRIAPDAVWRGISGEAQVNQAIALSMQSIW
jgi:hypothetical protein